MKTTEIQTPPNLFSGYACVCIHNMLMHWLVLWSGSFVSEQRGHSGHLFVHSALCTRIIRRFITNV